MRKGARVILACRDKRRAEKALARLKAEVPGASAGTGDSRPRFPRVRPLVRAKRTRGATPH
ncbi:MULTISPECIES: hypothetical protein [Paraburkholderia]|uniref:hypothetical protein n=1 Tax=Paraburkholderia TaxID=1822464 RepID=UPI001EF9AB97|nr:MULTISPECIES: hypothetical protein [Paraburkholderia]